MNPSLVTYLATEKLRVRVVVRCVVIIDAVQLYTCLLALNA